MSKSELRRIKANASLPKFTKTQQLAEEYNKNLKKLKRITPKEEWETLPKRPKRITEASIRRIKTAYYQRKTISNPADLKKAYNKERDRLKNFIKRNEKRGFKFTPDIVPAPASKTLITPTEIARLKQIKPKDLYKKSTYVTETDILEVSGEEKIKELRRKSALKGVETRRKRLEELAKQNEEFERLKRQQDEEEYQRNLKDFFADVTSEGQLILDRIDEIVDQYSTTNYAIAESLRRMVNGAINEFGEEQVQLILADRGEEVLEYLGNLINYQDDDRTKTGFLMKIMSVLYDQTITKLDLVKYNDIILTGTYYNEPE